MGKAILKAGVHFITSGILLIGSTGLRLYFAIFMPKCWEGCVMYFMYVQYMTRATRELSE